MIEKALVSMYAKKLNISFDEQKLRPHVIESNSFSKGLIMYLEQLKIQLNKDLGDSDAFAYTLQSYTELGSLVYPDPSYCYSLIPREVNCVDWESCLKQFVVNSSNEKSIIPIELQNGFNIKFGNVIASLVSLTLCETVGQYNEEKDHDWVSFEDCFGNDLNPKPYGLSAWYKK